MEVRNIPITELNPAKYNPRTISKDALAKLKGTIKQFGLVDPLIVNKDMTIIGGHQRFKACLELGFKEVPCVVLDLSPSKEKALNLALNKISGTWDKKKLEQVLKDIEAIDLDLTGFTEDEITKIVCIVDDDKPEYDIAPRLMEKYDYIVLFFRNELDFQVACDHFGVQRMKEDMRNHVGLAKAIDGAEYLRRQTGGVK